MTHMWVLKNWHFKKRMDLDKYANFQLKNVMHVLKKDESENL